MFRRYRTYCRKCQYDREHDGVSAWKEKNRARDSNLMTSWRRAHPLSRKLSVLRRRGVKVKGMLDILEAMYLENPACPYCHVALNFDTVSLDHKIPVSRGGEVANPDNWALCCVDCNYLKNTKTDAEFRSFLVQYAKRVMDNTEPSRDSDVAEGVTISPEITGISIPA